MWYARRAAYSPPPAEEVDAAGRLVYSWVESMSTEKTRAPSFARSAASGRPTTSDLDPSRGEQRSAGDTGGYRLTWWDVDAPVYDCDGAAVCAVAIRQERVVDPDALERFHDAEGRAGQNRFDGSGWRYVALEWCLGAG